MCIIVAEGDRFVYNRCGGEPVLYIIVAGASRFVNNRCRRGPDLYIIVAEGASFRVWHLELLIILGFLLLEYGVCCVGGFWF